ncbi:YcaO-like family protein [uncultured Leifsonia sp.]|uniref:YcaO-like family protein n=1 Tax=uncultured Leifsonia sp. TaxID=340359 RepID=UPI0028D87640|nr:YcaO-like family protein [uncultured Leifsonia sp.]
MKAIQLNTSIPWMPPAMTAHEADALRDMAAAYSPFGQIRNVLMVLRPGIGTGGYQGSATPMSLDHTLSRMLGLSGASAGLDKEIYGGGKGLSLFEAVASSLGEAVERMLGSLSSLDERGPEVLRRGTYRELTTAGLVAIGPDDLRLCAPEQLAAIGFLCEDWNENTELSWVAGTDLLAHGRVWVPAQLVHLFYVMQFDEARIGFSSSGGLATHITSEQALHHAILELIERDAINLSWYARIPPARIEVDRPFSDARLSEWLDAAERSSVGVTFYSHSLDIPEVSVVTAVAFDATAATNGYLAGGGVGLSVDEAMRSAVSELIQAERMVRIPSLAPSWELTGGYNRMFGISEAARPDDFDNFIQVVPFYGYPANRARLDWYFRPNDQRVVRMSDLPARRDDSPADALDAVLRICERHHLTPIAYDLTPSSFNHIRLRKVVIPQLAPAFPPNMPMLGHRRYREIRQVLGLDAQPLEFQQLTKDPLPFP